MNHPVLPPPGPDFPDPTKQHLICLTLLTIILLALAFRP